MCHRRDLPGQPPPSWRFTEQPQPWPGLTAAKRRQGLSQFGSLRSEEEPFCFICRFSKRVSVSQREIQVDRNPSSGTHRPLEMGLAQPAEQRMLHHSPAGHGSLPAPSQSDEDGDGNAKNLGIWASLSGSCCSMEFAPCQHCAYTNSHPGPSRVKPAA